MTDHPTLPPGIVLGASTSAYQIEGAVDLDGRGRSVWDAFSEEPGRIADGTTGRVACDSYRRTAEDIALMARLGLGGYRFSLAWPRILPGGSGSVNAAGLDHYDRFVDDLLAAGIAPMVTLYHWDLPESLQRTGGWLDRAILGPWEEYAAAVATRLGDRVAYWCPVNEPVVETLSGYAIGEHAPGERLLFDALPALHHLLLAHGIAVDVLRSEGASGAIGSANNHTPVWVVGGDDATDEDRAAADLYDVIHNRLVSAAILDGGYPEGWVEMLPVQVGDAAIIAAPLDFYGVNYYNPTLVGRPEPSSDIPFSRPAITGYPTTAFGWPVVPDGLREILVRLGERHPGLPPVHVTENGCSTGPDLDDADRIAFLDGHLRALADAAAAGVDVAGYWTWSLLDNWEWAEGFTQRFGLVHVDFDTLVRTPRRSFDWYAALIAAQGADRDRAG